MKNLQFGDLGDCQTHCQNKAIYWRDTQNKSILDNFQKKKDDFVSVRILVIAKNIVKTMPFTRD